MGLTAQITLQVFAYRRQEVCYLTCLLYTSRCVYETVYDALHAILPIGLWYQHREIWTLQREPEEEALSDKERVLLDMLREKEQTFSNLQAAQPRARELLQKMERLGLVACRLSLIHI